MFDKLEILKYIYFCMKKNCILNLKLVYMNYGYSLQSSELY